jgi:hypothetical protein
MQLPRASLVTDVAVNENAVAPRHRWNMVALVDVSRAALRGPSGSPHARAVRG